MKITKSQLKQIIKEEILKTLNEGSDSLKIISLEPWRKPLGADTSFDTEAALWRRAPAGAGKMQAEYNGETYTFYTALTADEKDVQIYDDTDTEVSEAFSIEQEQWIIAKMTTPEWKKAPEEEEETGIPARAATPEEKADHEKMVARYKKRMGYN